MSDVLFLHTVPSTKFEIFASCVLDGYVSLDRQEKVPVKVLLDTGTAKSFIVESILSFLIHIATGGKSPVLGLVSILYGCIYIIFIYFLI